MYGPQLTNEQNYFTLVVNLVVYSLTGNIRANEELWNTNHNSKSRAVKKTTIADISRPLQQEYLHYYTHPRLIYHTTL